MAVNLSSVKKFMRVTTNNEDTVIQSLLDAASEVVKSMLGLESSAALPDNKRVDEAVNLLTLNYYESRSFFKPEAHKAVMMRVSGLLDRDRDHTAFMPSVEAD